MTIVNIHEAKTNLSRLIQNAIEGEPFIIAKAGKPVVRVTAVDSRSGKQVKRIGFLKGQIQVPDDFDVMGQSDIEQMFDGS